MSGFHTATHLVFSHTPISFAIYIFGNLISGSLYREAGADRRPKAIKNRLTGPFLNTKELVEFVDFRTDLFLGL